MGVFSAHDAHDLDGKTVELSAKRMLIHANRPGFPGDSPGIRGSVPVAREIATMSRDSSCTSCKCMVCSVYAYMLNLHCTSDS